MGPSQDHLAQVKRDSRDAMLRHFRNDMEDNHYEPLVPLEETRQQLAGIGDPWSENVQVAAPAEPEEPKASKGGRPKKQPEAETLMEDQPNG